jgi:hypothetical protein
VAEQSFSDRVRHVANVIDSLGDIKPIGLMDHVYEPAQVQLRADEFARVFAGKAVHVRSSHDHRRCHIEIDGVQFVCCELIVAEHSTMTLPAKAEATNA